MQYRREIDGLRAVAVLPVLLFHAGISAFGGGFVGVDVFFVISGYLITSIIAAERRAGRFDLIGFYERRARRILPAMFLVMFACLPFAWFWLLPADMNRFSESLIAVSTFSSNILFWKTTGYFDNTNELTPLLHTWSLAVEEQYYLLFPVFLVTCWRLGHRTLIALLALVASTSLAAAHWGAFHRPDAAFFLLPTRGFELLIGALLAFATPSPKAALAQGLSLAGLAAIVAAVLCFDRTTPLPGALTLIPTLGTALVILFATPRTLVGRVLGSPALVGVGLISYGAYLWHQPLFAFARYRSMEPPGVASMLGLLGAALVLAYLSWRYVELPFRDRQRFTRRHIFSLAGACMASFMAIGVAGHLSEGYAQRFDPAVRQVEKPEGGNDKRCRQFDTEDACPIGASGTSPAIALLGDSHSGVLQRELGRALAQRGVGALSYAGDWCVPLVDVGTQDRRKNPNCRAFMRSAFERVLSDPRIETVILAAEWSNYTTGRRWNDSGMSYYTDAQSRQPGAQENVAVFQRGVERTLHALRRHGKRIVLVKSVPEYEVALPSHVAKRMVLEQSTQIGSHAIDGAKYLQRNAEAESVFERVAADRAITVVAPFEILCDGGVCRYIADDGRMLYGDASHLSVSGARLLVDEILKQVHP